MFHKNIAGQKEILCSQRDFFVEGNLVFTGKSQVKETQSFFSSGKFLGKLKCAGRVPVVDCAPPPPPLSRACYSSNPPPQTYNAALTCNHVPIMIYLVCTDYRCYQNPSHIKPTYHKCQMYRDAYVYQSPMNRGSETLPHIMHTKPMIAGKRRGGGVKKGPN